MKIGSKYCEKRREEFRMTEVEEQVTAQDIQDMINEVAAAGSGGNSKE